MIAAASTTKGDQVCQREEGQRGWGPSRPPQADVQDAGEGGQNPGFHSPRGLVGSSTEQTYLSNEPREIDIVGVGWVCCHAVTDCRRAWPDLLTVGSLRLRQSTVPSHPFYLSIFITKPSHPVNFYGCSVGRIYEQAT